MWAGMHSGQPVTTKAGGSALEKFELANGLVGWYARVESNHLANVRSVRAISIGGHVEGANCGAQVRLPPRH